MEKLNLLRIGTKHPNLACREINRRYYDILYGEEYNNKGIKIMDCDWDVLIILDACREDIFRKCCNIKGDYTTKLSRGSNTKEFLYGNFKQEKLTNTIYTTANPQFQKYKSEINADFYKVDNVWDSDLWDEDTGTVWPSDVTNIAKQNIMDHPHKRHLIHYLQPHYPFIGTELEDLGRNMFRKNDKNGRSKGSDLWGLQMRGKTDVPAKQINKAYYKNLKLALDSIENLINEIPGKVVITSDHGNMIGERSRPIPIKEWGHPSGIYTPELVKVPWLMIERGDRPKIHAGKPVQGQEDVDNEIVEDRLKDLGYV